MIAKAFQIVASILLLSICMAVLLKAGNYLLVYTNEQYRHGAKGWILYVSTSSLFLYTAILNFPGAVLYHLLIDLNQDEMKMINAGLLAAVIFSTFTFLFTIAMGGFWDVYTVKNLATIFIVSAFYPMLFKSIKKIPPINIAGKS